MLAKLIAPVILVASFTQFAFAQTEFTASLAGHAVLPAQTFIQCPPDFGSRVIALTRFCGIFHTV